MTYIPDEEKVTTAKERSMIRNLKSFLGFYPVMNGCGVMLRRNIPDEIRSLEKLGFVYLKNIKGHLFFEKVLK